MVLFENVHAFNVRSETRSAFRIPLSTNRLLVGAFVVSQSVHIGSMFIPGWRDVLGVEPVAFTTWAILLGITLSKFLVVEAYKHLRGRDLAERIYDRPSTVEKRTRETSRACTAPAAQLKASRGEGEEMHRKESKAPHIGTRSEAG